MLFLANISIIRYTVNYTQKRRALKVKKTTINAILMGIIVLLSISICLLLFAIVTRPRYSTVSATPEPAVITEASEENIISEDTVSSDSQATVLSDESGTDSGSLLKGKASAKVNIRNYASTDAKVVGSFEAGDTFDIIEVQSDGWTKIKYDDSEAYVSSDYVILINE
jgi:hypothetical protein